MKKKNEEIVRMRILRGLELAVFVGARVEAALLVRVGVVVRHYIFHHQVIFGAINNTTKKKRNSEKSSFVLFVVTRLFFSQT